MAPRRGKPFLFRSSHQLPRLRIGPLKGFLTDPLRAFNSPRGLLQELQGHLKGVQRWALRSQDSVKNCVYREP